MSIKTPKTPSKSEFSDDKKKDTKLFSIKKSDKNKRTSESDNKTDRRRSQHRFSGKITHQKSSDRADHHSVNNNSPIKKQSSTKSQIP